MAQVQSFSQGKIANKNEDYFNYNKECFVIADGATDKSGRKYNRKTGGELVSRLVVKEALRSTLTGVGLISFLNKKVHKLYEDLGITNDTRDPKYRFACYLVVVRVLADKLVVTCLGDSGFRVNGKKTHKEAEQIDTYNSEKRAKYIKKTGDIAGSREYIMPLLLKQYAYQNNPRHRFGYGVIDGTATPAKFVKVFKYPKNKVKKIELFTDGYIVVPRGATIKDWEGAFKKVEREDPDKWKKYKSTKSRDDRTIAIIKF